MATLVGSNQTLARIHEIPKQMVGWDIRLSASLSTFTVYCSFGSSADGVVRQDLKIECIGEMVMVTKSKPKLNNRRRIKITLHFPQSPFLPWANMLWLIHVE